MTSERILLCSVSSSVLCGSLSFVFVVLSLRTESLIPPLNKAVASNDSESPPPWQLQPIEIWPTLIVNFQVLLMLHQSRPSRLYVIVNLVKASFKGPVVKSLRNDRLLIFMPCTILFWVVVQCTFTSWRSWVLTASKKRSRTIVYSFWRPCESFSNVSSSSNS